MDHRSKNLTLHVLLVILACASAGLLFAQSSKQYQSFRTEYGHPDLQGVWNFSSNIPMQRDQRFGVREFLAPDELQEVRARLLQEAAQAAARASEADDSRGAPPKDTSLQSWISTMIFGRRALELENQPVLLILSIQPTAACRRRSTAMSFYTVGVSIFRVSDRFDLSLAESVEMGPKTGVCRPAAWSASTPASSSFCAQSL